MSPHGATSRQLLLVEDNPGDAQFITELLKALPDQIIHVGTLTEAVARIATLSPDAVLLDLRLPDAVGVECVTTIRAHGGDLPIVVLTGLDDEALALSCISAGAQDYLSKQEIHTPILRRSIGYAIARAAEKAEWRRAEALQERLAAIVEASSDAIVSSTVDGVITSWNTGAERIFGYTAAEAVGSPVREVMRAADAVGAAAQELRIAQTRDGQVPVGAQEIVRLRRDGTPVTLSAVSSVLRNVASETIGLAAICRDITETKRRDEELRRKNDELIARDRQMRRLTTRLHGIREEERTRISREVHDDLGQLLTGLKMDLRWIARHLDTSVPAGQAIAARLAEGEKLADRTIESVQRIAVELRPSALDALGLPAALRDEARRFEKRAGIVTRVQVAGAHTPEPAVATALFRIFQELLTNVARHAQAKSVQVLLGGDAESSFLRVEDDGVGIPSIEDRRANSLGLLGMTERAHALGGTIAIERGIERGTIAIVRVPYYGSTT